MIIVVTDRSNKDTLSSTGVMWRANPSISVVTSKVPGLQSITELASYWSIQSVRVDDSQVTAILVYTSFVVIVRTLSRKLFCFVKLDDLCKPSGASDSKSALGSRGLGVLPRRPVLGYRILWVLLPDLRASISNFVLIRSRYSVLHSFSWFAILSSLVA